MDSLISQELVLSQLSHSSPTSWSQHYPRHPIPLRMFATFANETALSQAVPVLIERLPGSLGVHMLQKENSPWFTEIWNKYLFDNHNYRIGYQHFLTFKTRVKMYAECKLRTAHCECHFFQHTHTAVCSSLCTFVHGQTCKWLTLDKPAAAGGLRVPLFWPMRDQQLTRVNQSQALFFYC